MEKRKYVILGLVLSVMLFGCAESTTNENGESDVVDTVQLASEIHNRILTLDSHCDSPLWLMDDSYDIGVGHDAHETQNRVDFPRMKEGGLDASFFAVFLGQQGRNPEENATAKQKAIEIFNLINEAVSKNSSVAEIAKNPEDAYRIEKTGKRAIYIGLENGYPIGNDLSMIEAFYNMGARYITLCHTLNNDICDSSTDSLEHAGLSQFGEKVVREMNRLGMMIDVSHISDSAFYDVLELSGLPVIASHSCARAICDSPRNLTDDMLKKLAEKGGVIQMCILNSYVKTPPPNPKGEAAFDYLREKYNHFKGLSDQEMDSARVGWYAIEAMYPEVLATVSDVVDHIDHIVKVAGIDHVGIGTDFDGGGGIDGCYDVSEMGNITLELFKRGYKEEEIEKIWSGNFMRVFRENVKKTKI